MEKTKLEQPVPFEDIYFRRSEGGPSVLVIEKPVPMSDANYRHGRQLTDPEKVLSFVHLIERHSIAEGTDVYAAGFKTIEGVEAESVGSSLDFTTSEGFLEITGDDINKTVDFIPLVKDEDNMVSNSPSYMATQQSIKAYADTIQHVDITADYTQVSKSVIILADADITDLTVTLLSAIDASQGIVHIKKIDSSENTVTIDASSTEEIDDGLDAVMTVQYECITLYSDGSEWWII